MPPPCPVPCTPPQWGQESDPKCPSPRPRYCVLRLHQVQFAHLVCVFMFYSNVYHWCPQALDGALFNCLVMVPRMLYRPTPGSHVGLFLWRKSKNDDTRLMKINRNQRNALVNVYNTWVACMRTTYLHEVKPNVRCSKALYKSYRNMSNCPGVWKEKNTTSTHTPLYKLRELLPLSSRLRDLFFIMMVIVQPRIALCIRMTERLQCSFINNTTT